MPNNNNFYYQNGFQANIPHPQHHPTVSSNSHNLGVNEDLFDPFSSIIPLEILGQPIGRDDESAYQGGARAQDQQIESQ